MEDSAAVLKPPVVEAVEPPASPGNTAKMGMYIGHDMNEQIDYDKARSRLPRGSAAAFNRNDDGLLLAPSSRHDPVVVEVALEGQSKT